ncbi:MAG: vitamin transporter [Blastocatellia bacterium]|nr:vitamin transporter [Blastocatellia bacterium]
MKYSKRFATVCAVLFRGMKVSGPLAFLIFFTSLSQVGLAQSSATISGRVNDQRGGAVAGAEVQLRSRTGPALAATTDNAGKFAFLNLAPGDYLLETTAAGFAAATSNELHLERRQTLTHDVTLRVATLSETVVITAAGTAQRVDEVSKAITLVDHDTIETRRELSLTEALRGTPGLRVQQQGSPGALTTLRLRGQRNFDTAILLDGLRVRDAGDINGSAVSLITDLLPVDLDRVEILRGSGSSIYGSNAIGGVVNLLPNVGSGKPHFELGFEGGNLGLFRGRLQSDGGLGKRAGYSFGLTRIDVRRGVDGEDEYGNTAGAARSQFEATPSITISGNFYGTTANARVNDSPFALPGAFTTGTAFPSAVVGVSFHPDFNNPDQGRRNRLLVGAGRFRHQVNENISYSIAFQRVSSGRRNYNGPAIDPAFAAFYPFGDFAFVSVNNGTTDTLEARGNFRTGRVSLLTLGMELERESIFQSAMPSFSPVNNTTDRQRTFAVFGQEQLFFLEDRLQISLGVRGQFFRISEADRPGFLKAIVPKTSLTGDASVAYFIRSTGTKLRAHVGNGFRAPSLFERFGQGTFSSLGFTRFGDPTLRAEQSISVDGGFDQRLRSDRVRFGATYFYTHLQRVVEFNSSFATDPLGLGRFSGYVNRSGGLSRGVESYFEASPTRGGNLRAAYTYTNSVRTTAASGLQPEFVIPRHLLALAYAQRYRAFLISAELNRTSSHISRVFENDFPFRIAELTFAGYTKVDLFGSYERALSDRRAIVFFGGADNLFRAKYFENGFRAPGVMARAGVNLKF